MKTLAISKAISQVNNCSLFRECRNALSLAIQQARIVSRFYHRLAVVALKIAILVLAIYAVAMIVTATPEQIQAFWANPMPALQEWACNVTLTIRSFVLHVENLLRNALTLRIR